MHLGTNMATRHGRREFFWLAAGAATYTGTQRARAAGTIEKERLTVGYIPMIDCAPLAVAQTKGFFERHGLAVTLNKEESWTAVREGLLSGRIDASHAMAGTPLNVRLGVEGEKAAPLVTAMTLNLNGNAITFSKRLWQAGVRSGPDLKRYLVSGRAGRKPAGAMVSTSSLYNYNLCYWLAHHGIHPQRDVRLLTLRAPQLIANLEAGTIDFFCITEPWNTRARIAGVGFTAIADRDIWKGHPEKVLAVMEPWAEAHPNTHIALVRAVIEACRWCDEPGNRPELVRLLSQKTYLGTEPAHLERSLGKGYDFGGYDEQGLTAAAPRDVPDFFVFHRGAAAAYLEGADTANYPWKSHGLWLLTQMARWGQIPSIPADAGRLLDRVYRTDVYRAAAAGLGLKSPLQEYKPETGFIDRRRFDPTDPAAYLKGFDIRA